MPDKPRQPAAKRPATLDEIIVEAARLKRQSADLQRRLADLDERIAARLPAPPPKRKR